jgi:uncharacterized membrane protein
MSPVEVLTEVSENGSAGTLADPAPSQTQTQTQTLANEHDADQPAERIGWSLVDAEQPIKESHGHDGDSATAAPTRSVRRATARRASNRRATARNRQTDSEASVLDLLAHHPGSTAGDLAKALNLDRGSVAARLTQLAKAGEIKKVPHGYSTDETAPPHTHQRPVHRTR